MVGMLKTRWAVRATGLLNSAKFSGDIAFKLEQLRMLREVLLNCDPSLLPEFAPRLTKLDAQLPGAARKLLVELLGEFAQKYEEMLPKIVPALTTFLKDETPPVVRQAILIGTSLFHKVFVKLAIQGLYSSEVSSLLKSSWDSVLKFKDAVIPLAIQSGVDGVRLLAVKFIKSMILLFTPDPTMPSDPPEEVGDGFQFNISWLKGGHTLLNVGDLAMEASQSLKLLLDQLKFPQVKSLSRAIIMVLINSLSEIAKRRPSFYGRILPVLLPLDPSMSVIKGVPVRVAHHALKNAFMACLQCTHSSAAPWRHRLMEALKVIDSEELGEQPVKHEKSSESQGIGTDGSVSMKEDKSSLQASDEVHRELGLKRLPDEDSNNVSADGVFEKRIRQSPLAEGSNQVGPVLLHDERPSMPLNKDGDSGPVLQLVGMFGALVAQGSKASEPLEILISSISSDLLAEVVMANMRYLPSNFPKSDDEGESHQSMSNIPCLQSSGSVPSTFSLSSAFPLIITSALNSQPSFSQDMMTTNLEHEETDVIMVEKAVTSSDLDDALKAASGTDASVASSLLSIEKTAPVLPPYGNDSEVTEGKIPGLESTIHLHETQELPEARHTFSNVKEPPLENAQCLGTTLPVDISPSTSASYSVEALSPRAEVIDASEPPSTLSLISSAHDVLPKMVAYSVDLSDEQKDQLQKTAFMRILEAYKQVEVSGGSSLRLSLLADLGSEFPLDLDPWDLLQKHVISDFLNHEGHELTLRVLYRLYREAEQDQDFLLSRTATSVYEMFLLNVAEALRDKFPASDKSLGRLLAEVPYLSEGVLNTLECLCSPQSKEKQERDFPGGDRITQGLSAVWSLILLRPSSRDRCLQIVLQSAVHHMEEVRMKAIRLVANKLFPMPSISQKIEDFASEKLHSVLDVIPSSNHTASSEPSNALEKDIHLGKPSSKEPQPDAAVNIACSSDSLSAKDGASSSVSEAQRCMSLYFALCTKKHSLFYQIFAIYKNMPMAAKEAVHRQIPVLVRTIGSSPELLSIVSDPPTGSENLLMQVLQTLTDGAVPSQDLISCVRTLYNSRMKDVEFLIPVLPFLSKDEIFPLMPQLVNLPMDKFQVALTRILQGSAQSGDSLSPSEVLISIHGIDSEKDSVPLKKIMDACSACFELRPVFTQQVLASVLNQLVEQIPLPLLFMRTVIQAIGVFPGLVDFVMDILSRLVSKQIWKYPKLWVGFLKCALQTKPQSFKVLLQLPAAQLENALNKNPVLRPPLVEHANQPNIRSTLPRSTLVVLGLANDPQRSAQASQTSAQAQQTSQSQAADTASSNTDPATEVTQDCATAAVD